MSVEKDDSNSKIECLIKRGVGTKEVGTKVPFGSHGSKQTVYHFKPIDPDDHDSPHVCNVPDQAHFDRLISIKEGFRQHVEGQGAPESLPDGEDRDFEYEDPYANLIDLDPMSVDSDWLDKFSREKLNIQPTAKTKLLEYLRSNYSNHDPEIDEKSTAKEVLRCILACRIGEEQNAANLNQ